MKKLVVYDSTCPMCRVYTKGMVAMDSSGTISRIGSDELADDILLSRIDLQRARHEIPMIDLDGEETLYGVDTWAYAFGRRSNWTINLLSLHWFRAILQVLYAFISFNRRIIITAAPGRWQLMDLQPEFRPAYRVAFDCLLFGLTGILYSSISSTIGLLPVLLLAQIGIAGLYFLTNKQFPFIQTILDYCGHLGMSLVLGGVIIAISLHFQWQPGVLIGGALAISQHFIRAYRLGINPWISAGFAAFYLLILPL